MLYYFVFVCSVSISYDVDLLTRTDLYGHIPLEMVEVLILGCVTFSVILLRFFVKNERI